jgi:hypothetical protein
MWLPTQALHRTPQFTPQVREVQAAQISHVHVLQVVPDPFPGVQVRDVRERGARYNLLSPVSGGPPPPVSAAFPVARGPSRCRIRTQRPPTRLPDPAVMPGPIAGGPYMARRRRHANHLLPGWRRRVPNDYFAHRRGHGTTGHRKRHGQHQPGENCPHVLPHGKPPFDGEHSEGQRHRLRQRAARRGAGTCYLAALWYHSR